MSAAETTPTVQALALADERAARGAAWLDRSEPSWVRDVDPDELEMGSCDLCVLGQVYGHYSGAPIFLPRRFGGLGLPRRYQDTIARHYGFEADSRAGIDYRLLADAWRREIARRGTVN